MPQEKLDLQPLDTEAQTPQIDFQELPPPPEGEVRPPFSRVLVNKQWIDLPDDSLKSRFDKFALERANQLSGQEEGILNPDPMKNPAMFGSSLPQWTSPDKPQDESWIKWAARGLYNNVVRPAVSPGGAITAWIGDVPQDPIPNPANVSLTPSKLLMKDEAAAPTASAVAPEVMPAKPAGNAIPEFETKQPLATPPAGKPLIDQVPELQSESRWQHFLQDQTGALYFHGKPVVTARAKLLDAIQNAGPARNELSSLTTAEKYKRMSAAERVTGRGEAGMDEFAGKMRGEYPKGEGEFEPLDLPQAERDVLFSEIRDTPRLNNWERLHARDGMRNLFAGNIPTDTELKALSRVFSKRATPGFGKSNVNLAKKFITSEEGSLKLPQGNDDFIETIMDKMPSRSKAFSLANDIFNTPRELQASFDFSAPFRQGLGLVTRGEFRSALIPMLKSAVSPEYYGKLMEELRANPWYELGQESGLYMSDPSFISSREEFFISRLARMVPFVKGSERAYSAFLNKLRQDTFSSMVKDARVGYGIDPAKNLAYARELASFINTASGRGSFGKLERYAPAAGTFFYSPRYLVSQVQLPLKMFSSNTQVRNQAIRSMAGIVGFGTALLTLGKAGGGSIETNPTDPDFMKLRFGNTRIDPWGGKQQLIVYLAQMSEQAKQSSVTGRSRALNSGYGSQTMAGNTADFLMHKTNPPISELWDLGSRDFNAKHPKRPIELSEETERMMLPLLVQDILDLERSDPDFAIAMAAIAAGTVGVGVQSYPTKKSGGKPYQPLVKFSR